MAIAIFINILVVLIVNLGALWLVYKWIGEIKLPPPPQINKTPDFDDDSVIIMTDKRDEDLLKDY